MAKRKKQTNWKPFLWGLTGTIFALSLNDVLLTYIFKDNSLWALLTSGAIIIIGLLLGGINKKTQEKLSSRFKA